MAAPTRLGFDTTKGDSVDHNLSSGSDRIVIGYCFYEDTSTSSLSPTYGGNAMTEVTGSPVRESGADIVVHAFYILESDLPADGTTMDFGSLPGDARVYAISYSGVSQNAPDDVVAKTVSNAGDHTISGDITTTAADALIHSGVSTDDNSDSFESHGTGQTEIQDNTYSFGTRPEATTEEFPSSAETDTQSHTGATTVGSSSYAMIAVTWAPSGSGDTTAPTLTNPTGTATGGSTADGSVDTDEGNGTLYWVVTESSTSPSVSQIQNGQNASGTTAAASGNQAVSATGTQNVSASGLTSETTYWFHFQHQDDAGNDSSVATSSSFTTDDVTAPTLSNPTASANGTDGYSGSVDTDEGNGTLYHIVTQSSTSPSATQVKNGHDDTGSAADASGSQAISSTGTKSVGQTGVLASSTQYWIHYMHEDDAGNQSTVVSSSSFTTDSDTDTTAPSLTNPTGTATGASTADGSVDTDEGDGTLYWVVTESSTAPSVSQIQAGQSDDGTSAAASGNQTVSSTGTQNVSASGLTSETTYWYHFQQQDSSGNDSTVVTSSSFTTDDVTAPTLSNPTGTATGAASADGTVDTDEGNGTLYWVVTESSTSPSVSEIQAGQNASGSSAAASGNQSVSSTGTQNVSASGLSSNTTYWFHFQQEDDANNDSSVATSSSFTTDTVTVSGSEPTKIISVQIWDSLEADGGSVLGEVAELQNAVIREKIDGNDQIEIVLPRQASIWSEVLEERIIRVSDTDNNISEWRIRVTNEERTNQNTLTSTITGDSIRFDLGSNSDLIERTEQDGSVTGKFGLLGLTPSEHLDFILDFAPSYFNQGIVDPTQEINIEYNWDTPLSAIDQILKITDSELEVVRQSDGTFDVNIVDERGSSAQKSYFQVGKNIRSVAKETDTSDQVTRIYPVGSGSDVEPPTIDDNLWDVDTASSNGDLVLADDPVGFDDQLNGLYAEDGDGNLAEITDSVAPDTITVNADPTTDTGFSADPSNANLPDTVRVRRNSSGDELTYLEHPQGVTDYGIKASRHEFSDISPVENAVADPFVQDWTSGEPTFYDLVETGAVGSVAVEQNTDKLFTKLGNSSARLGNGSNKLTEGDGLETDIIEINPTASDPFYSVGAKFKIVSGSVRLELVDVTNNQIYPDPDGDQLAFSSKEGVWTELLAVSAPANFNDAGTTQIRIRLVADEDGTEFYADGFTAVNESTASDTFQKGRAANLLWKRANTQLEQLGLPSTRFDVQVTDLERLGDSDFDDVVLGGKIQVVDDDLGLDLETRILEYERNLLDPGDSSVLLSSDPEDLAGLLGRQPVRGSPSHLATGPRDEPVTPADVDASTLKMDFESTIVSFNMVLSWNAVQRADEYIIKYGSSGVSWSNATTLTRTKLAEITLRNGKELDTIDSNVDLRNFDLLVKAVSVDGIQSNNAASLNINDPAPDTSEITNSDLTINLKGQVGNLIIDLTNSEATMVEFYASGDSGFAINEKNRINRVEGLDPSQGDAKLAEGVNWLTFIVMSSQAFDPLAPMTIYWKVRLRDEIAVIRNGGPSGTGGWSTGSENSFTFSMIDAGDIPYGGGGSTIDALKPAEAGADPTAGNPQSAPWLNPGSLQSGVNGQNDEGPVRDTVFTDTEPSDNDFSDGTTVYVF